MGILAEYNPELALREIRAFKEGAHTAEECVPENLVVGMSYPFKKKGQRLYYLLGEIPLIKTDGETLSLPIASIVIEVVEHTLVEETIWSTGTYIVKEIFTDSEPHFNGVARIQS